MAETPDWVQERLNRAHVQNQQLLASIPSILIGVDSDDLITHVNLPAEAAFGINAEEIIGKPFLECGVDWDWFEIITRIDIFTIYTSGTINNR